MNLRPLGYEPNELPGCSTPQSDCNKVRGAGSNWGTVPEETMQMIDIKLVRHIRTGDLGPDICIFTRFAELLCLALEKRLCRLGANAEIGVRFGKNDPSVAGDDVGGRKG